MRSLIYRYLYCWRVELGESSLYTHPVYDGKAHPGEDFDQHHDLSRKLALVIKQAKVSRPIFNHRRLRSTLVGGVMC